MKKQIYLLACLFSVVINQASYATSQNSNINTVLSVVNQLLLIDDLNKVDIVPLKGCLKSYSGAPIEGVTILIESYQDDLEPEDIGFYKLAISDSSGKFSVNVPKDGKYQIEFGDFLLTTESREQIAALWPNGVSGAALNNNSLPCAVGKKISQEWLNIELPYPRFELIDKNDDGIAEGVIKNQIIVLRHTNDSQAGNKYYECREEIDDSPRYTTWGGNIFSSSKFIPGLYAAYLYTSINGQGDTNLLPPPDGEGIYKSFEINRDENQFVVLDFIMNIEDSAHRLIMNTSSYLVGFLGEELPESIVGWGFSKHVLTFEVSAVNSVPLESTYTLYDWFADPPETPIDFLIDPNGQSNSDDSYWHLCMGFGDSSI